MRLMALEIDGEDHHGHGEECAEDGSDGDDDEENRGILI